MLRFVPVFSLIVMMLTGSGPAVAESFLELKETARTQLRARAWTEAATSYRRLVAMNPDDGGLWRLLGLCLLRDGRFDEADEALQRGLPTGEDVAGIYYDIACSRALAGRAEAALDALEEAYASGFVNDHLIHEDADLSSLHEQARFRRIAGWPDPDVTDRRERWLADIDYLERRLRQLHWRPFGVLPEAVFDRGIADLRASIDERSDLELRLDIQRLLASMGDGHTAVTSDFFTLMHGAHGAEGRFLPVQLFWYADGVRIVATTPDFDRLAGAKVNGIGGRAIDELLVELDPYVSRDNAWGAKWGLMMALVEPKTLQGLGLGDADAGFRFDVELRDGGRETVSIPVGGGEMLFGARDLSEPLGITADLRIRDKRQHLWMSPVEGTPALYVRMDGIRDGHQETLHQFFDRIFATAGEAGSSVLILDLRDNPGGQGHLMQPLLHRLIGSAEFNRRGHLYVLVGRKTFSAAMSLCARLEMHTQALFVGEPTGSRPNFVGESSLARLPYSGVMLSISSRYHQNGGSNDTRFWIAPDIPAAPDFKARLEGRDPALEAVLAELAAH